MAVNSGISLHLVHGSAAAATLTLTKKTTTTSGGLREEDASSVYCTYIVPRVPSLDELFQNIPSYEQFRNSLN